MIRVRMFAATVAVGVAAALTPAVASAAPTPTAAPTPVARNVVVFSIPAIGGLEAGPASVPGGSFKPVNITAQRAMTTMQYPAPPPAIVFSAANPASYYYQYAYRYLSISWHNITTGKAGQVSLRHWRKPTYKVDGYPASLPTSAIAQTGAGTVVATVRVLREQYQAPPTTISVIPGLSALAV